MTIEILKSMVSALVLTIIFEAAFIYISKLASKRNYLMIILANIFTNPLVNVIYGYFTIVVDVSDPIRIILIIVLEAAAALAEWQIYKRRTDIKKPFTFSICANLFSYLCGLTIAMF